MNTDSGDAVSALRWLDPAAGRDAFSIRKHIAEEKSGWIFLTYQQQHRTGLSRMICAALDVASRAVLSLPPDLSRRVVFGLDELPLLGKVQSIVELLTNGRKHGAVCFVGLQTIAQLRESYGRETAQTLLACLGSWLVLRVSDHETADFMSRYIGEQEIERVIESTSRSSNWQQVTDTRSTSTQQQIVTQRAVLASELQQLKDLHGYFNLAGPTPVARVVLQLAAQRKQAAAFVPAPPRERQKPAAQAQPQPQQNEQQQQQAAVDDLL
jgi:type IV secretory pathway TraG/TraD family ATPase VirD4